MPALACLLTSLVVAACGGGGGDPQDTATTIAAEDGGTATALGLTSARTLVPAPAAAALAASQSTTAEIASANAAAWPYTPASLSTLRASGKKVFAHYFAPFPLSIDNVDPAVDYYTANYLSPTGEKSKFIGSGGYIRQRPLPRAPIAGTTWNVTDLEQEVRRAAALGIDGFSVDILATSGDMWARVLLMMDAAQKVDPGFKVLLMPDMEAEFKGQPGNVIKAVRALASHPAAYRMADGRLVLSPYNAQNQTPFWWASQLAQLRSEGINVAFFPVFQGWYKYAANYAGISVGMSDWGVRSPVSNRADAAAVTQSRTYKTMWMSTVSPQDMRAKDLLYWEARNSENYRVMWENAINGGADWVQVVTWNDYSEGTEIAPSSGTQSSFYDLTAYYTAWFKTGVRPAITKDVLVYFHRPHSITAKPDLTKQTRLFAQAGTDAPADDIEVLAFATAPATVRVTMGSKVTDFSVPVGMSSVRVPLAEGTPVFELRRNNAVVTSVRSGFPISNQIVYQDLLYRGGSSTRTLIAPR
jgi:hypothetical protein